jgi:hypothetical protein
MRFRTLVRKPVGGKTTPIDAARLLPLIGPVGPKALVFLPAGVPLGPWQREELALRLPGVWADIRPSTWHP